MRQAANLWRLKERHWQHLLHQISHVSTFAIIDSFPLPVWQFARTYRCRGCRGKIAFGKGTLVRQTLYCVHVHLWLEWRGVITRFCVAPAQVHELIIWYLLFGMGLPRGCIPYLHAVFG